jgi:hypothetical protein
LPEAIAALLTLLLANAVKTTFTAVYWDDRWVEMSRQIYTAELIPKWQADD